MGYGGVEQVFGAGYTNERDFPVAMCARDAQYSIEVPRWGMFVSINHPRSG